MYSSRSLKTILLMVLIAFSQSAQAQQSDNSLYYGYLFGGGIGKAHVLGPHKAGLSAVFAGELEKRNFFLDVGLRTITQLQVLGPDEPSLKVNNIEMMLGRKIVDRKYGLSLFTGASTNKEVSRGAFLSSEGTFFSTSKYEKVTVRNFGMPVVARLIAGKGEHSRIFLELYSNFNKRSAFYAINFCVTANRFSFRKK